MAAEFAQFIAHDVKFGEPVDGAQAEQAFAASR